MYSTCMVDDQSSNRFLCQNAQLPTTFSAITTKMPIIHKTIPINGDVSQSNQLI